MGDKYKNKSALVPVNLLKPSSQENGVMEINIKVVFQHSLHNKSETPFIDTLCKQVKSKSNSSTTEAAEEKGGNEELSAEEENKELSTVNIILMNYINEVKSSIKGEYSFETAQNLELHIGYDLIADFKEFLTTNSELLTDLQFIKKTDLIDGHLKQYLTTQQNQLDRNCSTRKTSRGRRSIGEFKEAKTMTELIKKHEEEKQKHIDELVSLKTHYEAELSAKDVQINFLMKQFKVYK